MMTMTARIVGAVLVLLVLAGSALAVAISHNSPCRPARPS